MIGIDEVLDEKQREQHDEEHPGKGRIVRDALEAGCTADILDIHDDDADDLAKAEGRDSQIIAAQAQRRDADQEPQAAGSNAAGNQCEAKRHMEIGREYDTDIGTDSHETGMPQRELARIAVD